MNWNDFNLNRSDRLYFILTCLFTLILFYELLKFQMSGGVSSPDSALYLLNALHFAGLDLNNIYHPDFIHCTPVLCLLTSVLFKIGLVDKLAICIVSGIFGFFGNIGLYILLKNRFSSILCFTGTIIFSSFSVFLFNFASGLSDIASVSFSIWVIIFMIIASKKNSKYFLFVFPLLILGFFTRYTVGYTLPIIFLYYVLSHDILKHIKNLFTNFNQFKSDLKEYIKSDEFRYIMVSIIIAIILFLIISGIIFYYSGSLSFIEQSSSTVVTSETYSNAGDFSLNKKYYIEIFASALYGESRLLSSAFNILLFFLCGLGVIGSLCVFFINHHNSNIFNLKPKNCLLIFIVLLTIIFSFITFKFYSNHLITNILIIIGIIALFLLLKNDKIDEDKYKFFFINLVWFISYFIFISLYSIKVPRYAIPLLPPFIYFVVLGLDYLLMGFNKIFNKYFNFDSKFNLIPIILVIFLIFSTFSYVETLTLEDHPRDLVNIAEYIENIDSNYHSKTIICYKQHNNILTWNLKTNTLPVLPEDVNSLDNGSSDYIILNEVEDFENYSKIYSSGNIYLYSKNYYL